MLGLSEEKKLASKNITTQDSISFFCEPIHNQKDRISELMKRILSLCPGGTRISFGSYGCKSNNTENTFNSRSRHSISTYIFIKIKMDHTNTFLLDKIKRICYLFVDHKPLNREVTNKLNNNLSKIMKATHIKWHYNALNEDNEVNLASNILVPYFLIETFDILKKEEAFNLIDGMDILKVFRPNTKARKFHEGQIRKSLYESNKALHHVESELFLFSKSENIDYKISKNIALKSGVIKSIKKDCVINVRKCLADSHAKKPIVDLESVFTVMMACRRVSLVDSWQGQGDRIQNFITVNNRKFNFDIFNTKSNFSMVVVEPEAKKREQIVNFLTKPYKKFGCETFKLETELDKVTFRDNHNIDPFNTDLNQDKYELVELISQIAYLLIDKKDQSDITFAFINRAVNDFMKKEESKSIDDLYIQCVKDPNLSNIIGNLKQMTSDGKYGFLFNKNISIDKNLFQDKEFRETAYTINLMLNLTHILIHIRTIENNYSKGIIVMEETLKNIKTGHAISKFFEAFYRKIRVQGVCLLTVETGEVSEAVEDNYDISYFLIVIIENSIHRLINTKSMNIFLAINDEHNFRARHKIAKDDCGLMEIDEIVSEYLISTGRCESLIHIN